MNDDHGDFVRTNDMLYPPQGGTEPTAQRRTDLNAQKLILDLDKREAEMSVAFAELADTHGDLKDAERTCADEAPDGQEEPTAPVLTGHPQPGRMPWQEKLLVVSMAGIAAAMGPGQRLAELDDHWHQLLGLALIESALLYTLGELAIQLVHSWAFRVVTTSPDQPPSQLPDRVRVSCVFLVAVLICLGLSYAMQMALILVLPPATVQPLDSWAALRTVAWITVIATYGFGKFFIVWDKYDTAVRHHCVRYDQRQQRRRRAAVARRVCKAFLASLERCSGARDRLQDLLSKHRPGPRLVLGLPGLLGPATGYRPILGLGRAPARPRRRKVHKSLVVVLFRREWSGTESKLLRELITSRVDPLVILMCHQDNYTHPEVAATRFWLRSQAITEAMFEAVELGPTDLQTARRYLRWYTVVPQAAILVIVPMQEFSLKNAARRVFRRPVQCIGYGKTEGGTILFDQRVLEPGLRKEIMDEHVRQKLARLGLDDGDRRPYP